ncbi:MAG: SpoIIE family protein phosphatase [Kiritimatiellae bacterium]|nr:SpoIIE family protein phosphatase [Kiritimatiellia bacterium]
MTERRRLGLRIAISLLLVFVVTLAANWLLHHCLSEKGARKVIDRTFQDVQGAVAGRVNARLVRQAMAARERLEDGYSTESDSLERLAHELQVTEISVADGKGVITASSVPEYVGFDFSTATGQAAEMMCLVQDVTEFCQPFCPNSAKGLWRKYVGVWRPTGGFVQLGCDGKALRDLARSSLVGRTRNWHVEGEGGVVITTPQGLVLSDYAEPNREGTHWIEPDDSYYWRRREVEGFLVYVLIPKSAAAVTRNMLVGAAALLNGLALVLVAVLVGFVIAAYVRRELRRQTEKELKVASDIQYSALPNVFPPFPEKTSFDIFADMKTAKEVGGDFYDFYFTGINTLVFLIADVSGKGVPAAMFMMRAKTLIKSLAQTGKPLDQVVREANNALCEGNDANMFVTAWIGQINLDTGHVTYVNAGHNPPVVRQGEKVDFLSSRVALVLGGMPGIPYKSAELQLAPGDAIYLYTDGITEQANPAFELYGNERLLTLLRSTRYRQETLLPAVFEHVMTFAEGAEQADDCTQLVLCYRGEAETESFDYPPTMEGLKQATADLERCVAELPMKAQTKLMVAADEIFANIVNYSGASAWTLKVEKLHYPDVARLIFIDDGKPFDPLALRDPDTTLSAEKRKEGGLGILIVKKTMSPVTYSRKNGKNILTMGFAYGD